MTSDEPRDSQDVEGIVLSDTVFIGSVVDGSAAAKAGLSVNDIIVGFSYHDNIFVDMLTMYSFEDHAYNIDVGDTVTFTVKRGVSTISFTVTVTQTS